MELKQRLASIARFVSMMMFIGGLLFFYSYASDAIGRSITQDFYILQLPKSLIFYSMLILFAAFNIIMNVAVKLYRDTKGEDRSSMLFFSAHQKAVVTFWATLTIAGFNVLLAAFLLYVGFIRIEELAAMTGYIAIPVLGIICFFIPFSGLIVTLLTKR
ncbi:MAG: hypothetical protein U5K79_00875 [Cyclobacteriaceae bacterium]|nr:hypothetical protein [Cyclobacteriaceae bacterium]